MTLRVFEVAGEEEKDSSVSDVTEVGFYVMCTWGRVVPAGPAAPTQGRLEEAEERARYVSDHLV